MDGHIIGQEPAFYPLRAFGLTHSFFSIDYHTVVNTWISMSILLIACLIGRYFLSKPDNLGRFIIKEYAQNFIDLIEQSIGHFVERYFLFITTLFTFIITCNWSALIPYVEEPTKNLNTTLALGIIAFLYMHIQVVKSRGFGHLVKEFLLPFDIMFPFNLIIGLAMLPLKILGELSTVVSISFRLFGNIFGGFIITQIFRAAISGSILFNILGTVTGINLLIVAFFIVFEGFLQAFVFSILTLTNIAMAVQEEHENTLSKV